MAEIVVGTPSVAGFTTGLGDSNVSLATLLFLMQQRNDAGICDVTRDIHKETSDNHVAIERAASAALVATVENAHNIEIAIEKTAAAGLLATKVAELATANQFAIAALTAANNTAAIQAAIAECCCETKALIIEKANGTDALIRQLDADNVRQELQDAKAQILFLQSRSTPQH